MAAWADLRERLAALPEPPAASIYRGAAPQWFTEAAQVAAAQHGAVIVNVKGQRLDAVSVVLPLSLYEELAGAKLAE